METKKKKEQETSAEEPKKKLHEKPTMVLYMYSKSQEFPVNVSHESFLDMEKDTTGEIEEKNGYTRWLSNVHYVWAESLSPGNESIPEHTILEVKIRRESFGLLLYDNRNDRIFLLNEEGYALLQDLFMKLDQDNKSDLYTYSSPKFDRMDIVDFVQCLEKAELWHPNTI